MKLDDLYRDVVLDHYRHPRGREPLTGVDASARGVNPSCGDDVTVKFEIKDDTITGVQVDGRGCAISTAAGSMLAEVASGKTVDDLRLLAEAFRDMIKTGYEPEVLEIGDLVALAGVFRFPVRVKCAMLPLATVLEALDNYYRGAGEQVVTTEDNGEDRAGGDEQKTDNG